MIQTIKHTHQYSISPLVVLWIISVKSSNRDYRNINTKSSNRVWGLGDYELPPFSGIFLKYNDFIADPLAEHCTKLNQAFEELSKGSLLLHSFEIKINIWLVFENPDTKDFSDWRIQLLHKIFVLKNVILTFRLFSSESSSESLLDDELLRRDFFPFRWRFLSRFSIELDRPLLMFVSTSSSSDSSLLDRFDSFERDFVWNQKLFV